MKLKLANFSAYARPEAHLAERTTHGAIVTIICVLLSLTLFIHETSYFWRLHTVSEVSVDLERRHDLPINIDMTFPAMPCAMLSLDVLDISGTAESDNGIATHMTVHKTRVDASGKKIGRRDYMTPQSQEVVQDAFGGSMVNVNINQALKHLSEMEEEAGAKEGCHLAATLKVKRVAGRVHLSVHQQMVFQMLPQLMTGHSIPVVRNMSHIIHEVSFGPHYPGRVNPLDGLKRILDTNLASFKYFLKVVPTEFYARMGGVTETHQYSVSEYSIPLPVEGGQNPAIDLMYDMSPVVVTINTAPPSILHYVVRISAIIGGVFTLAGILDRHIHWILSLLGGNKALPILP